MKCRLKQQKLGVIICLIWDIWFEFAAAVSSNARLDLGAISVGLRFAFRSSRWGVEADRVSFRPDPDLKMYSSIEFIDFNQKKHRFGVRSGKSFEFFAFHLLLPLARLSAWTPIWRGPSERIILESVVIALGL